MFNQALQFLLKTVVDLFVLAALVRFFLQLFRAPFRNPISEFVMALTDFVVKPMRRFVPGLRGVDLASLVFAWGLEALLVLFLLGLQGQIALPDTLRAVPISICLAFINLLKYSIYLLIIATFAQALLSWLNPYSAVSSVLDSLTRPFLLPLRKIVPMIGNIDLTPLALFIICQLILMLPLAWLEALAIKMV